MVKIDIVGALLISFVTIIITLGFVKSCDDNKISNVPKAKFTVTNISEPNEVKFNSKFTVTNISEPNEVKSNSKYVVTLKQNIEDSGEEYKIQSIIWIRGNNKSDIIKMIHEYYPGNITKDEGMKILEKQYKKLEPTFLKYKNNPDLYYNNSGLNGYTKTIQ
jgi:hypothetical protein